MAKDLWVALTKWLKYFLNIEVAFDIKMVIINDYVGKYKALVNIFIIVMKQLIYSDKCLKVIPTFQQYAQKIIYWYQIEKLLALENRNISKFEKKWKPYMAL